MNIDKLLNFFYTRASQRIKEKIRESGLKYGDIYPNDTKLISWIVNNRLTKNNRFLITDRVVEFYECSGAYGLLPKLNFKDKIEIFWGTEEEINSYIYDLFILLWEEVSNDTTTYGIDNDLFLCDYIPYAKYKSFWNILFSKENKYPALAYGIYEDDVVEKIDNAEEQALIFLYKKCQQDFLSNFKQFAKETSSFHKINKVFKENFIEKSFVPLLEKHTPNSSSLGLRVRDLIYSDLSHTAPLIYEKKDTDNLYLKRLINASSSYILELEKIQEDMLI